MSNIIKDIYEIYRNLRVIDHPQSIARKVSERVYLGLIDNKDFILVDRTFKYIYVNTKHCVKHLKEHPNFELIKETEICGTSILRYIPEDQFFIILSDYGDEDLNWYDFLGAITIYTPCIFYLDDQLKLTGEVIIADIIYSGREKVRLVNEATGYSKWIKGVPYIQIISKRGFYYFRYEKNPFILISPDTELYEKIPKRYRKGWRIKVPVKYTSKYYPTEEPKR